MKLLLIAALTYRTFAALGTCGGASSESEVAATLCPTGDRTADGYYGKIKNPVPGTVCGAGTPAKCVNTDAAHQTLCCAVAQKCSAGIAALGLATACPTTGKTKAKTSAANAYCASTTDGLCTAAADKAACCENCAKTDAGASPKLCLTSDNAGVSCAGTTGNTNCLTVGTGNFITAGVAAACTQPGVTASDPCSAAEALGTACAGSTGKVKCTTARAWAFKDSDGTATACTTIANSVTNSQTCTANTVGLVDATCKAEFFKTAKKASRRRLAAANAKCDACAAPTAATLNALTVECSSATDSTSLTCKTGYYNKGYVAAVVCTKNAAAIAWVKGVCTACATDQTGCTATKSTATTCAGGKGPNSTGKLKCTAVDKGYKLAEGGWVSPCTYAAWTKEYDTGDCKAKTCNPGYKLTANKCDTAFVCKKGAVTAGYAATGIVAATAKAAELAIVACNDAAGAKVTGSAGEGSNVAKAAVAEVKVATEIKAVDATKATDLGTITCATGYTAATPKAICPAADGAFTYSGCTKKAAPAAVAQTMIGFVLTIIAMYL